MDISERHAEEVCLGLLTFWGVKPLSRIEYPLEEWILKLYRQMGLNIDTVTQSAMNGNPVAYTIISMKISLIKSFKETFQGKLISLSRTTGEILADYFGIPKCCRNANIDRLPNGFLPEDQGLLFHWACPGCKKTRGLIPIYREAWNRVRIFLKKGDINLLLAPYSKVKAQHLS